MEPYTIGDMIRELRKERGYSQEMLCEGICTTGNLSKIENNTRKPEAHTLIALLQRLGREDIIGIYPSKEEREVDILIHGLMERIADRDVRGLEEALAGIEKSPHVVSALHKQYIQFARIILSAWKGRAMESVLSELAATLQMTKRRFELGNSLPDGLYTYNEIVIVNAIAVQSYHSGREDYAIALLLDMKKYMDEKIPDEREKGKKYTMILLNLSIWFCNRGQYAQALQYADEGILYCIKYDKLHDLPKLLATKGSIQGNLSRSGEARKCFVQSWYLFDMLGNAKGCEEVCRNAKKEFGISLRGFIGFKRNTFSMSVEKFY